MAPDREEAARMKAEFSVDDHGLWPSLNPENPNSPLPPAALKLQNKWDDISKKTQTQMESFSTEMSQKDSDFLEQTKVENRKKYDYRSFLRKFAALREEMHVDPDTFDYVLYTFGLSHYGNMPLIEPQEFREVKKIDEFVIVIDVSMSVTGELVHAFLEQTYSILSESESYLHKVNIRILQCDEKVLSDEKITSQKDLKTYMEHFELKGQGGTDFRPAFDYVADLIRKNEFRNLRGLLYFTDGKGIFPKKKPPYETAFIFCEESADDRQVPPWAIKLILPTTSWIRPSYGRRTSCEGRNRSPCEPHRLSHRSHGVCTTFLNQSHKKSRKEDGQNFRLGSAEIRQGWCPVEMNIQRAKQEIRMNMELTGFRRSGSVRCS